jgi:allophanate hydrolase subunit 1
MIYKFLTQEIDIGTTANDVNGNQLIRVVNLTSSNNTLLVQYANGVTYASGSVLGKSEIVVNKNTTDLLIGTGMYATAVAYRN